MKNSFWRELVAERCGGSNFDAPDTGYSFSKVLAEERELDKGNRANEKASALLKLSIADPRWKMSQGAFGAALQYYTMSDDATRYTDNNGIPGTHELIAKMVAQRFAGAAMVTPSWVQYSPGAIKRCLAEYIPTAFFDRETALIFPTPGYGVIKSDMNRRGAQIIDFPLVFEEGKWSLRLDDFPTGKLVGAEKRFMYLNSPHNPTGIDFDYEQWIGILDWADKLDIKLVVDEAYVDIRYSEKGVSVLEIPNWEETCLVLQSISKGWNATGARFGWVVGEPTAIAAICKVMDVKDSGGFGPTIAAGLYCLDHPELAVETQERYLNIHQLLAAALNSAGFISAPPDGGLCQLTVAPRSANCTEFKSAAECAKWFRENLRISLMHYDIGNRRYLRWATTFNKVPECGLPDEESVIKELGRRLQSVKLEF